MEKLVSDLLQIIANLEDFSNQRRALTDQIWLLERESSKLQAEILKLVNRERLMEQPKKLIKRR